MKSSVYKLSDGVYLADVDGRRIMRGSLGDLATALAHEGVTSDDLLLGDWREDAELLSSSEQNELFQAMAAQCGQSEPVTEIASRAGG
jgi:hypothetical protein